MPPGDKSKAGGELSAVTWWNWKLLMLTPTRKMAQICWQRSWRDQPSPRGWPETPPWWGSWQSEENVGDTAERQPVKKTWHMFQHLLSTWKQDNKGIKGLIACVAEKVHAIKDLWPTNFMLDDLDNKLYSMTLTHTLLQEYSSFISLLMLIDKLDRLTIHEAFRNEELNHEQQLRTQSDSAPSTALATSSNLPVPNLTCEFCGYKGHLLLQCRKSSTAKTEARKLKHAYAGNTPYTSGNLVYTPMQLSESPGAMKTGGATEFTRNASYHSAEQTLLSLNTHLWNADMGATSHMKPHWHWLHDYSPFHVPIWLADNTIIYLKGVGNVVFNLVISGRAVRPVEFIWVLHILDLQNNLLAVLPLSRQYGIYVHIVKISLSDEI